MKYLLDANILIYAFRVDERHHATCLQWLTQVIQTGADIYVSGMVEVALLRITTNPRPSVIPARPEDIFRFLASLHALPNYQRLELLPGQFGRLESLCAALNLSGNDMNDAYLAAIALENDLTLISADRGFERFTELKLINPLSKS